MTLDDLKEQIDIDIADSEGTLSHLAQLRRDLGAREPTVHELAAFGAYVRDLYQGLENILLRVAKFKRIQVPDGADWHSALVNMFSHPPDEGVPELLVGALNEEVLAYRGFRHVFNKRYSAHLDWAKLKPLVENAATFFRSFHSEVQSYVKNGAGGGAA